MDANHATSEAVFEVNRAIRGGIIGAAGLGGGIDGTAGLGDDGPMPGQFPFGADPLAGKGHRLAKCVVAIASREIIGTSPVLPVLLERDADLFLLRHALEVSGLALQVELMIRKPTSVQG